jgi:hypothetical protein
MHFSVVVLGTIRTVEDLLIRSAHQIPFVLELKGNQLNFKFMIFDYITLSETSMLVFYAVSIGKQISDVSRDSNILMRQPKNRSLNCSTTLLRKNQI